MKKIKSLNVAKKRDRNATINKIYEAAMDVFSNCSYEAASTKKIAEKAGVNSALIFNYFGNKLGLFNYVVNRLATINEASMEEYPHKDDVEEDLKSYIHSQVYYQYKFRNILKSLLFLRNFKNIYDLEGNFEERSESLRQRLNEFKKAGKVDENVDTAKVALNLFIIVDAVAVSYCVHSNEKPEFAAGALEPVIELMVKGMQKNSG